MPHKNQTYKSDILLVNLESLRKLSIGNKLESGLVCVLEYITIQAEYEKKDSGIEFTKL